MIKLKDENGVEYKARLEVEFERIIDKRLKAILLGLADEVEKKFKKDIVITCLDRTVAENQKVNGSPFSSHLDHRASDIRSYIYTQKEIDYIVEFLYNTWGKNFIFVKVHDAGSGNHIHLNINYKYRRVW